MASEYKTAIYTREQLDNARTKGQVIGWVQGGASVGVLLFLLQFLGWIPLVLVAGLLAFLGYKFVKRSR
jgi:MFS superfamily sulfate permease-like transporter